MEYEKKYKEALKKARQLCLYPTTGPFINDLQDLFPELKESEDEKVRKGLINGFKQCVKDSPYPKNAQKYWHDIKIEDILAWLEKQGKEIPVGKVEPFDKYEGLTDFERTLADICIGWIGEEPGWKQYIKDNADVLLKIAIKKFNSVQDVPFEQNPAWTKEDESNLQKIIYELQANKSEAPEYDIKIYDKFIDWLKSLKQRIGWKPSEEQMECLYDAINHYQTNGYPASKLNELYKQMSKIYKL